MGFWGSPWSPHPPRLGRYAAPTARRSRVWVRAGEVVGDQGERRDRPSAGVEPPSAGPQPARTGQKPDPVRPVSMSSHLGLDPARRCRPHCAHVGALSSRCDAAALGADQARLRRARRDYFGVRFPRAAAARLCWSTSGPNARKVLAGASRRRVPVNPGRRAGDAAREAAAVYI